MIIIIDNLNWGNSENVLINNIETSAILEDVSNALNYYADKYIITKYKLKTGDIVEHDGITYIVISQIDRNIEDKDNKEYNYRARIRQADFTIKFIIGSKLYEYPVIIEGQKFTIENGQYIQTNGDKIIITMTNTEITDKLKKQDRLIKFGSAWKIQGMDKTKNGLISLYCDADIFNDNDDRENEIADRWKYEEKHNYVVKINNTIQNALPLNSTLQLDVTVTDNEEVVTLPLTYASSNETILTIDENGLVSCVGVGTATITVAITDNTNIKDTIDITVEEEIIQNISYTIIGLDDYGDDGEEIYYGEWCRYTIHKFIDNIEVEGNFTFELDSTDLATITETGSNYCIVTAKDVVMGGNIVLKVTDTDTGQVVIKKTIKIIGM